MHQHTYIHTYISLGPVTAIHFIINQSGKRLIDTLHCEKVSTSSSQKIPWPHETTSNRPLVPGSYPYGLHCENKVFFPPNILYVAAVGGLKRLVHFLYPLLLPSRIHQRGKSLRPIDSFETHSSQHGAPSLSSPLSLPSPPKSILSPTLTLRASHRTHPSLTPPSPFLEPWPIISYHIIVLDKVSTDRM
mmetsp:Transcript_14326/g.23858  ORF Transcript_14326/g.23858 Transcript_14326/m.23858 type:complete len:189 (-) Transcript_14326:1081-1647(-)